MTKGHPLKGCLFYFPNFFSLIEFFYIWKYENHPRGNSLIVAWPGTARGPAIWQMGKKSEGELAHSCMAGYCPGSRYLANGKKSEGELAHSCEGRCSPSDSPLSATLKNKKAEFAGEEMDNRDIIWWILFRNGCDVVERQFISKGW